MSSKNFHFIILLAATIIISSFIILTANSNSRWNIRNTFGKANYPVQTASPNDYAPIGSTKDCKTNNDCVNKFGSRCPFGEEASSENFRCACESNVCTWVKQ